MLSVEIRVLIRTLDPRDNAADRVEAEVRRILAQFYPTDSLYIEQVKPEHVAGWR